MTRLGDQPTATTPPENPGYALRVASGAGVGQSDDDERMRIEPSWQLLVAVILLVGLAVAANLWGTLGQGKSAVIAAVRAAAQLLVVSSIIVAAIQHLWSSALFVLLMFGVAVYTTAKRTQVTSALPYTALAVASGVVPVLAIIYLTGTAPLNGFSLIPIGGIIIGNMMTAHTLTGRRVFAGLRDDIGIYEAALSLGMTRSQAIGMVTRPLAPEALVPNLDATRTVGLVTLPGAYIGVLLGGGTAIQAGASQLLVLLGIMSGQTVTIVVANSLIRRAKLLPDDLRDRLRP